MAAHEWLESCGDLHARHLPPNTASSSASLTLMQQELMHGGSRELDSKAQGDVLQRNLDNRSPPAPQPVEQPVYSPSPSTCTSEVEDNSAGDPATSLARQGVTNHTEVTSFWQEAPAEDNELGLRPALVDGPALEAAAVHPSSAGIPFWPLHAPLFMEPMVPVANDHGVQAPLNVLEVTPDTLQQQVLPSSHPLLSQVATSPFSFANISQQPGVSRYGLGPEEASMSEQSQSMLDPQRHDNRTARVAQVAHESDPAEGQKESTSLASAAVYRCSSSDELGRQSTGLAGHLADPAAVCTDSALPMIAGPRCFASTDLTCLPANHTDSSAYPAARPINLAGHPSGLGGRLAEVVQLKAKAVSKDIQVKMPSAPSAVRKIMEAGQRRALLVSEPAASYLSQPPGPRASLVELQKAAEFRQHFETSARGDPAADVPLGKRRLETPEEGLRSRLVNYAEALASSEQVLTLAKQLDSCVPT